MDVHNKSDVFLSLQTRKAGFDEILGEYAILRC